MPPIKTNQLDLSKFNIKRSVSESMHKLLIIIFRFRNMSNNRHREWAF